MPLLNKEPFCKEKIPTGLKPLDQVFHCKLTNEIFVDYEKFFSRVILCNSMVWSCELSGKAGLTYEDAHNSELKMIKEIKAIPEYMIKPILFLANQTQRNKIMDMTEDVFNYVKDRYFVGELVDVFVGESMSKKICEVLKVLKLPDPVVKSSNIDDSDGSDVICLDDPPPPGSHKATNEITPKKINEYSEARFYEYIIQDATNSSSVTTVPVEKIIRRKFLLTRSKCRMILKYYSSLDADGIWRVDIKKLNSIKLELISFDAIFTGPIPKFTKNEYKRKSNLLNITNTSSSNAKKKASPSSNNKINKKQSHVKDSKQTSIKQHFDKNQTSKTTNSTEKLKNGGDIKKVFEQAKQQAIERDKYKLSSQELQKLKKQEIQRKKQEALQRERELNLPREDLLCTNLKDLPTPTPLDCPLPVSCFAETITILEFINTFRTLLDLHIPKDISFESFTKSLLSSEIDGLFSKVTMELLAALMRVQDEELEAESLEDVDKKMDGATSAEDAVAKVVASSTLDNISQTSGSLYLVTLRKLSLDVLTMTEILRLHLLSSGSLTLTNSKHDYQHRGGYNSSDDPGILFQHNCSLIIKKLATISVFECSEDEKVKILNLLIDQILTYAVCRDYIEEKLDNLKIIHKSLRAHQIAISKRKKDEVNYWQKKKQEDKSKTEEAPKPERRSKILTDKEFEDLPSENLDWEKITDDEKKQMHSWESRKEKELREEAASLQPSLFQLGMDRTYRRYWFFKTLPGIFVEDNWQHMEDGVSLLLLPQSSPKKTPSKNNIFEVADKENICNLQLTSVKDQIDNKGKVVWSFFYSIEQIVELLDRLNNKGIREINLKKHIAENESLIVESMLSNNFKYFNQKESFPSGPAKLKSKLKNPSSQASLKYASAAEAMEATLKDTLLDIEERIYDGTLGSMKDIDRHEWRSKLEENTFDEIIGQVFDSKDEATHNIPPFVLGMKAAIVQIARMVENRYLLPPLVEDKSKKSKTKDKKKKKEEEKEKDKDSDNESTSSGPTFQSPFDSWINIILSPLTMSLSQISVHASVLETSIAWSKCTLHSKCRICRKKGDAAMLLLCDGCDRGHHTYCLDPPVKVIPEGDWFCPSCKPKDVLPRTPRKNYQEVSEEEDADEEDGQTDEETGEDTSKDENDEEEENDDSDENNDEDSTNEENDDDNNKTLNDEDASSANETDDESDQSDDNKSKNDDTDETEEEKDDDTNKKKKSKIVIGKRKYTKHGETKVNAPNRLTRSRTTSELPSKAIISSRERRRRSDMNDQANTVNKKRKSSFEEPNAKRQETEAERTEIEVMRGIEGLVTELVARDEAWPFLKPVTKKEAPDYFDIIKTPMDFSHIRSRINRGEYSECAAILSDIRLIFSNCMEYNMPTVPQCVAAQKLSRYFERRLKELKLTLPVKKQDSLKRSFRRKLN